MPYGEDTHASGQEHPSLLAEICHARGNGRRWYETVCLLPGGSHSAVITPLRPVVDNAMYMKISYYHYCRPAGRFSPPWAPIIPRCASSFAPFLGSVLRSKSVRMGRDFTLQTPLVSPKPSAHDPNPLVPKWQPYATPSPPCCMLQTVYAVIYRRVVKEREGKTPRRDRCRLSQNHHL